MIRRAQFTLILALISALVLSVAAQVPSNSRFLLISDLHFNPMADTKLVDQLAATDPAQWEAILDQSAPGQFSQYGSDTNWWLLKSALQQFPRTLRHPAFVMVTGDLLAHDFPNSFRAATHDPDQQRYAAFVRKTVQFLAQQLQKDFPGAKIFITPGNNDNDCGDYTIEANGVFLSDTAEIAKQLAQGDDQFVSDWKSLGSFTVPHPTAPNMRIISLNSIFLSANYKALSSANGCKDVSSNAPQEVLDWLEKQLKSAEDSHQKAWLMMHIPPGIDGYASASNHQELLRGGATDNAETCGKSIVPMWLPEWTARFDALLKHYQPTVMANFAAHIHSDDFRLFGDAGAGQQFMLLGPAISPVYRQNPAFRVMNYRSDGTVTDQTTYCLKNLPKASNRVRGKWGKEYMYARKWKVKNLNAQSLSDIYAQVSTNEKARSKWLKLFAVSGPAEEGEKPMVRGLYCADKALTVDTYKACYCGKQ